MDDGIETYLAGLPPDRRTTVERLHRTIRGAVPQLDVRMWDYSGGLIGYGTHTYRTKAGVEGEWFALGVSNRKGYVSLYSNATVDGGYLLERYHARFPGTTLRRSCVNITRPDLLDDAAVAELATETAALVFE